MSSILSSIFNKSWSIKDLMTIDQGRQDRSNNCKVDLIKTYHEVKKESILDKFKKNFKRNKSELNIYYVVFKFRVTSDSGNYYNIFIRTSPDFNIVEFLNNKIQVFCPCKDFMYRSAWTLQQHDSLFRSPKTDQKLGTSITDTPKTKTKTSTLCKHVFAAIRYLASNYETLMKNL